MTCPNCKQMFELLEKIQADYRKAYANVIGYEDYEDKDREARKFESD
jgi:thiol-disulfide isomerase/thioredoxin